MMIKDQLDALSYEIRGAAMEVYNHFGPGLLESLYESALIVELQSRDILQTTAQLSQTDEQTFGMAYQLQ